MSFFVRIEERWMQEAVALHIGRQSDGMRVMLGPGGKEAFSQRLDDYTANPDYEAALVLPEGMARELLRVLSAHYGGADDTRALRKDYDAERGRVDKLTDAVIRLAAAEGTTK